MDFVGLDNPQRLAQRTSTVLNWHIKSRKNGLCTECGHVYPCRTRLMLVGRETDASKTTPIKLK